MIIATAPGASTPSVRARTVFQSAASLRSTGIRKGRPAMSGARTVNPVGCAKNPTPPTPMATAIGASRCRSTAFATASRTIAPHIVTTPSGRTPMSMSSGSHHTRNAEPSTTRAARSTHGLRRDQAAGSTLACATNQRTVNQVTRPKTSAGTRSTTGARPRTCHLARK